MKRILLGVFLAVCVTSAHAVTVEDLPDYCLITSSGVCTWCSANSDANELQQGYCNGRYAGCVNGASTTVYRGQTATGTAQGQGFVGTADGTYVCMAEGFCYTSCPNTVRWSEFYGGIQRKEELGGCKCDTYQASCSTPPCYRCTYGYYGTADNWGNGGCDQCPGVENANGEMVYGTSMAGNGTTVEECLLRTTDVFGDNTGRYVLTGDCPYKS